MIYGKNEYALQYKGINSRLDLALEHITPEFLGTLKEDRVELDGNNVYCFKVDLVTTPAENMRFENHHEYIDVHLVIDGAETMEIGLPENLTLCEESAATDAYFYEGEGYSKVTLIPGEFLVLFPEDAHKTQIMVESPKMITKVVFKVRV